MPVINISTVIYAPVQRVFDLSRSITLHTVSMSHTNEKAVAGVTKGIIKLGETVTWEATHLFKKRLLTTYISAMTPYSHFSDVMIKGDFKMMKHDHYFETESVSSTLMTDIFIFETPFKFLGEALNFIFLKSYMTILLKRRNAVIKEYAESDKWKNVL